MPKQALVIADYIMYMADYVVEMNIRRSADREVGRDFGTNEARRTSKDARRVRRTSTSVSYFDGSEEFLVYKKRFVSGLDEKKLRIYWKQEMEQKDSANELQK